MDEKLVEELLKFAENEMNKTDITEWISIPLSVLAIVVSVITIIYQVKMNNTNLQSVYFEQIFGKYLKDKIPQVMDRLEFDENGKLSVGYKNINKVFMAMIRDCGYFKYAKNDFYYELREKTMELDEELVRLAGETVKEKEKQDQRKLDIHKRIQKIIILINKNYQKF